MSHGSVAQSLHSMFRLKWLSWLFCVIYSMFLSFFRNTSQVVWLTTFVFNPEALGILPENMYTVADDMASRQVILDQ